MTTNEVLEAMQRGALLHLEHVDGKPVYWLDNPHRTIPIPVARCVLSYGSVKPRDDMLFATVTS